MVELGPIAVLAMLAVVVVAGGLARRLGWSVPLVMTAVGLVLAVPDQIPNVVLDPEIVLVIVLPPLLYSAALDTSYLGVRRALRPILGLSVGLVLFTTLVVGYAVHWLVPSMPLAVAFALGAIVAPPDAVATTAIGRTLGLPRRLLTVLGGESLINDATALTAYRMAVAAAIGQAVSAIEVLGMFLLAAVGGIALGLAGGALVVSLVRRLNDPVLEVAVNLLTPFVLFAAGEEIHSSGVLAVVVAGLFVAHRSPRSQSWDTRLQSQAVWRVLDFLLEGLVFLLIGLQLSSVLGGLDPTDGIRLAAVGAFTLVVVIVSRFVFVFALVYGARLLPGATAGGRIPRWRAATVVSWAGMRGVVSLAAAYGLPLTTESGADFPSRDLVVLLTFVVVLGTLVIQGLTLPWVIRHLHVAAPADAADALAEAAATHTAARAGLARLDELLAAGEAIPDDVERQLRARAEAKVNRSWERLDTTGADTPSAVYRRVRREMLDAERDALVTLRDDGRLEDEVLRDAMRDLDFEEAILARE